MFLVLAGFPYPFSTDFIKKKQRGFNRLKRIVIVILLREDLLG